MASCVECVAPLSIAIAVRKDSPKLRALLNEFLRSRRVGTTFGNVVVNRYYKDSKWVLDATATRERKRYLAVVDTFKTYAKRYDFDHLMLISRNARCWFAWRYLISVIRRLTVKLATDRRGLMQDWSVALLSRGVWAGCYPWLEGRMKVF